MKNILFFFLATSLFFSACQQNSATTKRITLLQQQLTEKTTALQQAEAELSKLKKTEGKQLVHSVYFKLNPKISSTENLKLVEEISKLNTINVVNNLEYGVFQDVGDSRALFEYGFVIQMSFNSLDDYYIYQEHQVHLNLKEQVKKYLAGPPATYDYWTE